MKRTCSALLVLTFLAVAPLRAQQAPTAAVPLTPEEAAAPPPTAPVVVDGVTLFSVRGVSSYPAGQRANEIADRITAVASERSISVDSLTVVETLEVSQIVAGTALVMGVLDADARLEGVRRSVLASASLGRIRTAIQAYRHDREPGVLGRAAFDAVATGLALGAVLLLVRWVQRRLRSRIEGRYRAQVRDLHIHSFQLVRSEQLWRFVTGILALCWAAFAIVAVYVYLQHVLTRFPWTRGLGLNLQDMVAGPLQVIGAGTVAIVPKLVFLAVLAIVTRYLLRVIRLFFDAIAAGTVTFQSFDPEWAVPTYRLVRILIIAFAVVVAYPYVPGSQTEAFKGLSLFIGLIFSLGSSSLIGNFIAGYSMTYRRAFRVGDVVKMGQHTGVVQNVRLLVTHLRTPKNEEVVIPNSAILGGDVVNYSTLGRQGQLILHTTVGIGYETSWQQVEAMLLEAARRTETTLKEPRPFVLQKTLGDFAVTYEINVYSNAPDQMPRQYAELHRNILDVFNEYGVQIMTPAYEGDPEQPKVVPPAAWYAAPARPPESQAGAAHDEV
jgi:small-conductance mechanosensitive channel